MLLVVLSIDNKTIRHNSPYNLTIWKQSDECIVCISRISLSSYRSNFWECVFNKKKYNLFVIFE